MHIYRSYLTGFFGNGGICSVLDDDDDDGDDVDGCVSVAIDDDDARVAAITRSIASSSYSESESESSSSSLSLSLARLFESLSTFATRNIVAGEDVCVLGALLMLLLSTSFGVRRRDCRASLARPELHRKQNNRKRARETATQKNQKERRNFFT